jgi:tRNA(fMet)-specific endonuclease VapC
VALILDTNALSAFVDGDERLLHAIESEAELAIPTIVLGEYLYGIGQSRKRAAYQAWIRTNLPFFDVIPVVRETAERYAEIRHELKTVGTPIPTNDLWIAALARQHQLQIVTRDAHFRAVRGLRMLAW